MSKKRRGDKIPGRPVGYLDRTRRSQGNILFKLMQGLKKKNDVRGDGGKGNTTDLGFYEVFFRQHYVSEPKNGL